MTQNAHSYGIGAFCNKPFSVVWLPLQVMTGSQTRRHGMPTSVAKLMQGVRRRQCNGEEEEEEGRSGLGIGWYWQQQSIPKSYPLSLPQFLPWTCAMWYSWSRTKRPTWLPWPYPGAREQIFPYSKVSFMYSRHHIDTAAVPHRKFSCKFSGQTVLVVLHLWSLEETGFCQNI